MITRLDFLQSEMEFKLFRLMEDHLRSQGYRYLSIPSAIKWSTLLQQEVVPGDKTLFLDMQHCLSGSAEQGILEYFERAQVDPINVYAKNQCFRHEDKYSDYNRCKEFIKIEQFTFCYEPDWEQQFEQMLKNGHYLFDMFDIKYRIVDVTERDSGYHKKKFDIEILTERYGWMETHSCTYFGTEQSKRFKITGADHTLSNTGIASPRMLIPFFESYELTQKLLGMKI